MKQFDMVAHWDAEAEVWWGSVPEIPVSDRIVDAGRSGTARH